MTTEAWHPNPHGSTRDQCLYSRPIPGGVEFCVLPPGHTGEHRNDRARPMSAPAEAPRPDLDLLVEVWCQFAMGVPGRPDVMHDGGLSVMEDVAHELVLAGRIVPAGIDGKDWYRLAALPASPQATTPAPSHDAKE
jgi:hypothetical protein